MEMCCRKVCYEYNPVVLDLDEQQKCCVDRSLANSQTIQTKFLGKICHKKAISLPVTKKSTKFLGKNSDRNIISQTKSNEIA